MYIQKLFNMNIFSWTVSAQARRQSSSVILPLSFNDDLSESEESWGSEFEESMREDEEVYEVLGKPNEGVGAVCFNIFYSLLTKY